MATSACSPWRADSSSSVRACARVSPEVEIQGLDVPEFGVLCYPDYVLSSTEIGHASGSAAFDSGRS